MVKVLLSANSIAGLREEAQKFLAETSDKQSTLVIPSQVDGDEDDALMQEEDVIAPVAVKAPANTATDARGFPWDERIHAATQGFNKDGSWRYRRGVEQGVINQVENELILKVKNAQSAAVSPAVPVAPIPVAPVAMPQPTLAVVPPIVATPAPLPPQPAPVTFTHSLATFKAQVIPTLAELVKQGKLTQPYIESLKQHYKVDEIWRVNDQQLSEIFELFCSHGLLQKVG